MSRTYCVYILASESHELYIGVTNNIVRRLAEHRAQVCPDSFASRRRTVRLVYLETAANVRDAIRREKQLKGWRRRRKLELIESANPQWRDLAEGPPACS